MFIVTISSKGQLVIPKDIRETLGIKPGKKVHLFGDGSQILFAIHACQQAGEI